jgi:organic hydroperoxide reductase OsmC/OhrA
LTGLGHIVAGFFVGCGPGRVAHGRQPWSITPCATRSELHATPRNNPASDRHERQAAMGQYNARLVWQRADGEPFTDNRYSRRHTLGFDGGVELPASSSPQVVPLPMSDAAAVDPEEMFVASLASCHMLWFLSIAAGRGWCVDHYADDAVGTLARDPSGRMVMTEVTLRPCVLFGGERRPEVAEQQAMHHDAHDQCFIANSVKTVVACQPRWPAPPAPSDGTALALSRSAPNCLE